MAAIINGVNLVKMECPTMGKAKEDLTIEKGTLDRVRAVFRHYESNEENGLEDVISHIEENYGYSHAVFFYNDNIFPTSVLLIRKAVKVIVEGPVR